MPKARGADPWADPSKQQTQNEENKPKGRFNQFGITGVEPKNKQN